MLTCHGGYQFVSMLSRKSALIVVISLLLCRRESQHAVAVVSLFIFS